MMGFEVHIGVGEQNANFSVSIPEGKWLRITHVSGWLFVNHPQPPLVVMVSVLTAAFQVDAGTISGASYFAPTVLSDGSLAIGQSTNILTMGDFVGLNVQKNSGAGTIDGLINIIGELLDPLE